MPDPKPQSPEQQKPLRASPVEAGKTRGDVVADSQQALRSLADKLDDKHLRDMQDDDVRPHEWLADLQDRNIAKRNAVISQIEKYLPDSPGRKTLIMGLSAPQGSEQFKEAYRALEKVVVNFDKRARQLSESDAQLKEIKEDKALSSLGGMADTVINNFKRGSGLEKVASIAAVGFLGYFIHKFWKKPTGKWIIGLTGGALAVNVLTRLATGKSLLEHAGIWEAKTDLAPEIRKLAEKSKIADNPQKLKALSKMGDMDMRECYEMYKKTYPGASIDPTRFEIYDNSVSGTETYTIIDEMVKRAGGDAEFKKKFIDSKHNWTLFETAMTLFRNEGMMNVVTSNPESEQKFKGDMISIFGGTRMNPEISKNKTVLFVAGYPVNVGWIENGKKPGEDPEYRFTLANGKSVSIGLKDNNKASKIVELREYIREAMIASLPADLQGGNLEYTMQGEWIMRDANISGTKTTLKFEFDKDRTDSPYTLRILNMNGGLVRETATGAGDKSITVDELKRSQISAEITRHLPVFNDMHIDVISSVPNSYDPSWNYVTGTIEGIPFTMAVKGDNYILYRAEQLLHNDKFVEQKVKQAEAKLKVGSENLKTRIDDIEERLLRLTVVYKGGSGSVKENLWKFTADAKCDEFVKIYEFKIRNANSAQEADKIWQETVEKYDREMKALNAKLDSDVLNGVKYSDEDFENVYKQLNNLGYDSPEMQATMTRIYERMQEFDYEGWDKSDVWELASKIYSATREVVNYYTAELATEKTLNPNQQAYLKYLESSITAKLGEVKLKSQGLFKKSVNMENLPLGRSEWNIKPYRLWFAENPNATP